MAVFEYLMLGSQLPQLKRAEYFDVVDLARAASTLPLFLASRPNETAKGRLQRWHGLTRWMLRDSSSDLSDLGLVSVDFSITDAPWKDWDAVLKQLSVDTPIVMVEARLLRTTVDEHRAILARWERSLTERILHAEAAEAALWQSAETEMSAEEEPAGEAAAFQRAVRRRDALIAEEPWLSSAQIAEGARGAVVESNANQYAYTLRQTGQILGVRHNRVRLHPACQFHHVDGRLEPLPVMRPLLALLPKDDSGWTQAFWLFQPTGHLAGARPADLLSAQPDDVIVAAKKDFHGDDGI